MGKQRAWRRVFFFFFLLGFSFTEIDDLQDRRGRERTFVYSTLPLPPAHVNSDIYLQLCIWDDCHVFLITTHVFTRLLLDEIYHFIELPFDYLIDDAMFVCLLDNLILGFLLQDLTRETGGFELASTITLVLQENRLTKCASHPHHQIKRNDHVLSDPCTVPYCVYLWAVIVAKFCSLFSMWQTVVF